MEIKINSESEIDAAARELLAALGECRHVALEGTMGAGKTTLTAAIGRVLGVADDVTSPTFSIINQYESPSGERIYHFDFYRIETPSQASDLGLDDYFDSGALCLMEWAGNVEDFLPDDTVVVHIEVQPDGTRVLRFDNQMP